MPDNKPSSSSEDDREALLNRYNEATRKIEDYYFTPGRFTERRTCAKLWPDEKLKEKVFDMEQFVKGMSDENAPGGPSPFGPYPRSRPRFYGADFIVGPPVMFWGGWGL
jgi:hypothetical protein